MKTQEIIKSRILQLCDEHGYNINSLSHRCGIPSSTLKSILYNASKNTGIVTIKMICDGLGISLYDFFNTDDFKNTEMEDTE